MEYFCLSNGVFNSQVWDPSAFLGALSIYLLESIVNSPLQNNQKLERQALGYLMQVIKQTNKKIELKKWKAELPT